MIAAIIVAVTAGALVIAVSIMLADEIGKLTDKLGDLIWALDTDRKGLACITKDLDLTLNTRLMEIGDALEKLEGIQDQLSAIEGWCSEVCEKLGSTEKEAKT